MKYIPQLCTGEALWSFGLTEAGAGSDSRGSKTTAELRDNEWIINGSKIFITNGSVDISMGCTVQAVSGEKDGKKYSQQLLLRKILMGLNVSQCMAK